MRKVHTGIGTMSIGSYDEDEHERRERKNADVDLSEDDDRIEYHGSITYDAGDSAEALLDQFKRMKEN
ncbi:hypothetical protein GCM10009021_09260 [Halarchaeum nitratireducens]|uniref:DUF5786 domain-containing protein n=2 Tax=Halarchaeum nitratireducens TaxID=489913 RepID=A0A830G8P4_9EURY|nr:hypothetical protein [Halarchaeum solikamskense]GGN11451.1 hypothetical protein GCM10009021_09260 [Halarchaeum nitratireducens]